MLFQFLKFMEEADMGTTIFKTDENFNNFTKVSAANYGLGNIIEEQECNN
jgi:hypothetical protein